MVGQWAHAESGRLDPQVSGLRFRFSVFRVFGLGAQFLGVFRLRVSVFSVQGFWLQFLGFRVAVALLFTDLR